MKTKSTDDFFDSAPAITCNKPSGMLVQWIRNSEVV